MCEKADKGGFSACIYVFSCFRLPSIFKEFSRGTLVVVFDL